MIGNGHAGFGRAASEKDPKGTSPTSYLGDPAIPERSRGNGHASEFATRCGHGRRATEVSRRPYDWSRTHARARGGEALARLEQGDWPAPGTVTDVYGTWAAARADAFRATSVGSRSGGRTWSTDRQPVRDSARGSELIRRLKTGRCELCEQTTKVQVHQIRNLAALNRPGQPQLEWMRAMAKRRRKTLVVCATCHAKIHHEQPTMITT